MKVYEVNYDYDFQSFVVKTDGLWKDGTLSFEAQPKAENWQRLEAITEDPHRPESDFINFIPGALLLGSAIEHMDIFSFCEMAGELLPVANNGREYQLLNVLECINCLDQEKTEWKYTKSSGKRMRILKYAFNKSMFPESSVFKIPENIASRIFTYEGLKDPEDEFKPTVEKLGLTGLNFELVWEG